jgi:hypothetical protein
MKKPQRKPTRIFLSNVTVSRLIEDVSAAAWNDACCEWEKWHEELRLALGAQPGDDLIEFAAVMAALKYEPEDVKRLQDTVTNQADVIAQLRDISDIRLREIERLHSIIDEDSKEIECNRLRVVLEEKDDEIEQLNERIAGKDDMLDTAAKVISLQRDAMALLLESVKTQKGEPDES